MNYLEIVLIWGLEQKIVCVGAVVFVGDLMQNALCCRVFVLSCLSAEDEYLKAERRRQWFCCFYFKQEQGWLMLKDLWSKSTMLFIVRLVCMMPVTELVRWALVPVKYKRILDNELHFIKTVESYWIARLLGAPHTDVRCVMLQDVQDCASSLLP